MSFEVIVSLESHLAFKYNFLASKSPRDTLHQGILSVPGIAVCE